jgi:GTP-binding protein YchF
MNLSVGIVGLPNVGKSTLFNALLKRQQAYVANFPFATIEPNVGIVDVPDWRLDKLSEVVKDSENMDHLPPKIPATVEFVDIAGLIAGASKGEGLGNRFLAHIRETSAICHVVRMFSDPDVVKQGVASPEEDFEAVETELKLADLQTLEKQKSPGNTQDKEALSFWEVVTKLKDALSRGVPVRDMVLSDKELKVANLLSLITVKPIIVCLNVDESNLRDANKIEFEYSKKFNLELSQVVAICAKIESDLASLSESDQRAYLADIGIKESGLERLIKKAFKTLGLITFLTAGEKEVRAWTIRSGTKASVAAGVIHSDFEKKFIKADVVDFEKFVEAKGWVRAREKGMVRSEGRDYVMRDGDVVEFKIGS